MARAQGDHASDLGSRARGANGAVALKSPSGPFHRATWKPQAGPALREGEKMTDRANRRSTRTATRHLIRLTGIIITVTILLAVVAGTAQAGHVRSEGSSSPSTDGHERAEDATAICLALVGGTALLAGGVWAAKLRNPLR